MGQFDADIVDFASEQAKRQPQPAPSPVTGGTVTPQPSVPATAAASPFDDAVAEFGQRQHMAASGNIIGAQGSNPDAAGKALTLAPLVGAPPGVVATDLPSYEQQHQIAKNARIAGENPRMADWLAGDPMHARVSMDDFEHLGTLSKITKALGSGWDAAILSNQRGRLGSEQALGAQNQAQVAKVERDLATHPQLGGIWGKLQTVAGFAGGLTDNLFRGVWTGIQGASVGAVGGGAAGTAAGGVGLVPGAVIGAGGGLAVGTGVGFKYDMARAAAGNTYLDLSETVGENGQHIPEGAKDAAALLVGLGTYALAGVGTNKVAKPAADAAGKLLGDAMKQAVTKPTVQVALGNFAKTLGKSAIQGAALNAAMEGTSIFGEELGKQLAGGADYSTLFNDPVQRQQAVDHLITAATDGAMLFPLLHLPLAGGSLVGDTMRARQSKADVATFDELMTGAAENKTRERSMSAFQSFMEAQTGGTPVENLNIAGDAVRTLYQSAGVEPGPGDGLLGDVVPGLREQMAQVTETGGDIVVPTAAYVAHLAGTPISESLRADIRFRPDGMTMREAQAYEAERGTHLADLATQGQISLDAAAAAADPGRQVYADIFSKLRAAGQSHDAATQYATLVASRYEARAERFGGAKGTALDLYKAEGLDVRREMPESLRHVATDESDLVINALRNDTRKVPRDRDLFGPSLHEAVKEAGGIVDNSGELRAMDLHLAKTKGLIRKATGDAKADIEHSMDAMALRMWERGYFPDKMERPTEQDLIDAMRNGDKVFAEGAGNERRAAFEEAVRDLDEFVNRQGIDVKKASNAEIKAAIDKHIADEEAQAGRELLQGGDKTATPEFKAWFGDSKVVDAEGKPLVVYHGTPRGDFDQFDTYAANYGLMGQGGYFTEDPAIASSYTEKGAAKMERRGEEVARTVYPVYLKIKRALDMEAVADRAAWERAFPEEFEMFETLPDGATNEQAYRNVEEGMKDAELPMWEGAEAMQGGIRSMGFDGITHIGGGRVGDGPNHRVWIVFDPEQIKSVNNRGTFNPSDPRILNQGERGKISLDDGRAVIDKHIADEEAQAGRELMQGGAPFGGMTREQFLGDAKITKNDNAADLKPKALKSVGDAPAEKFAVGDLAAKYSADGAAVFDGEKVIASYNFGDTLVVDKKYRGRGVAQELVYQWRSRYPAEAVAKQRTKASQAIQEKVWDRIASERRSYSQGTNKTSTPEFKAWFGDSKVVDAEGKPLVVYKGAPTRSGGPSRDYKGNIINDAPWHDIEHFDSPGTKYAGFFSDDPAVASRFAEGYGKSLSDENPAAVFPAYAKIDRPFVIDAGGRPAAAVQFKSVAAGWDDAAFRSALADERYDGVIIKNTKDEGTVYIPKSPEQIKSVNNRGTFDPSDPRILMQGERGRISLDNGKATITLFKDADLSTFLHETGHLWLEELGRDALDMAAPDGLRKDWDTVKKWLGVKEGQAGEDGALAQAPNTDAFKAWFGDSKVVDLRGEPLRVYHGTNEDFAGFKGDRAYFTADPEYASKYARYEGGNVKPVYLSIRKPLDLHDVGSAAITAGEMEANLRKAGVTEIKNLASSKPLPVWAWMQIKDVRDAIKAAGYDGVIQRETQVGENAEATSYIAFDPSQIKSVHNRGTFDPSDPRILNQGNRGQIEMSRGAGLTTEQHEQFARGFETYLMEGRAPSSALASAFRKFKSWLVRIYKSAAALHVPVNDEIRGVFDRMIASDDAIASWRQAEKLEPVFVTAKDGGMTDAEFSAYTKAIDKARNSADEKMLRKTMEAVRKERTAEWKAEAASVRAEVEPAVLGRPDLRAQYFLRTGKNLADPDAPAVEPVVRLSREALDDMYGTDEASKALPSGIISAKDGAHPDEVADLFGYRSGDEMVRALMSLEASRKQAEEATGEKLDGQKYVRKLIDDEVRERMLERHGDALNDGSIEAEALAAVHNAAQADVMTMEARTIARQAGVTALKLDDIKAWADGQLNDMPVDRATDVRSFARQEAKAGREAQRALLRGDFTKAFEAKQRQIINHVMATKAAEMAEQHTKDVTLLRKLGKTPRRESIQQSFMDQIHSITERMGIITKRSEADAAATPSLNKFVSDQAAIGQDVFMPEVLLNERWTGDVDTMKAGDFFDAMEGVRSLLNLGRAMREMEVDGERIRFAQIVDDMRQQVGDVSAKAVGMTARATSLDKIKVDALGIVAALKRVENWALLMDGGNRNGPFTRYIVKPVFEATEKYRPEKQRRLQQLWDILEPRRKELNQGKIYSPELNYTFVNKGELLHAIGHTGNESNLTKLLLGRGWGEIDADGKLDRSRWDSAMDRMHSDGTVKKADYDTVQQIWDLLEEMKPAAQAAHKSIYGVRFDEVTAAPFQTPWGEYKGGYMPAIVDRFIVEDGKLRDDVDALKQQQTGGMFPSTGRGFTKSRVANYNKALELNLSLIPSHIDSVLRFTHLQPTIRDVGRLMLKRSFRELMRDADPAAVSSMLTPWLARTARQTVTTPALDPAGRAADKVFNALRRRSGVQILAFNVSNTLQQFVGVAPGILKSSPGAMMRSLYTFMRQPQKMADEIAAASPYMEQRMRGKSFDLQVSIEKALQSTNKFTDFRYWSQENAHIFQHLSQNLVDIVTWRAAYDHETARGMTDAEAIHAANAAVRETQGGFNPEEVSRFETGGALGRLFSHMYSYFGSQANLLGTELALAKEMGFKKGSARAAMIYTFGLMIPAVVSDAIYRAVSGSGQQDQEDGSPWDMETLASQFLGSQAKYMAGMVPIAGPVAVAVIDSNAGDRIGSNPTASAVKQAVKAPSEIYGSVVEGKAPSRGIRDGLTALGLATGLPLGQAGRPVGYLADVATGHQTPTSATDVARGLMTGKQGEGAIQ